MMLVRFYEWSEFLDSLKTNPPQDRTVELTLAIRHDHRETPHLLMLAACRGREAPREFLQCFGIRPTDPGGPRAAEMQRLYDEREQALKALDLTIRSGRYISPSRNGGEPAA
jgi:hypothetical protein